MLPAAYLLTMLVVVDVQYAAMATSLAAFSADLMTELAGAADVDSSQAGRHGSTPDYSRRRHDCALPGQQVAAPHARTHSRAPCRCPFSP